MANNKFDIKVFTDELNKAFTILKKEQVLEKYMKNVLLNYNSIIYIGNITDEPNKYNTIYNYMYGEDNTLCNIVIFETDGFVDSESNIIPSGIHIAYPYLDYSVCIDYKYILNINNSATTITPSDTFFIDIGTITNINNHLPAYTLSSDEKSSIDNAYNNNKIVYVKFNYTNENNNTETIILPIESKIAQTGGAYTYYGGGTLQNHEVWNFSISATSVFVNNITNATDNEVNNLFTNPEQPIPKRTISLENLNAFKQQIENEINNEIGNVLVEEF